MRHKRHIAILLFVVLLLSGESASAARLLNVRFESAGRLLLETYYQDGELADAATVWRYLGRRPIMVEESPLVVADTADPTRADLSDDVTISVQHAGRLIARAKVSGLTLTRGDPRSLQWFLPGAEVERTARAAGLGQAVSPGSVRPWWIMWAGFALLCLSLWWLTRWFRYNRDHLDQ
jgi:hypothetical protein